MTFASLRPTFFLCHQPFLSNFSKFCTFLALLMELPWCDNNCTLCSTLQHVWCSVSQCVAVCCSVLQCVAACCSVLQCVALCGSVLAVCWQCVAVCCSVLQCVAVCCSVLQCVAVCRSVLQCSVGRCSRHVFAASSLIKLNLARTPT